MPEKKRRSAFFRGEAGFNRMEEERGKERARAEARKNAKKVPFRFFVPMGDTRPAIILDDKPDFFMYEHQAKGPDGHWNVFSGCVKQSENCPACEVLGRESYYAMVLSILDLTPYKTRDGTQVPYSRKLLIVKSAQQKKFQRLYNQHGTLRGAQLDFTRDGEKDPSIGNDIEFVGFVGEDELVDHVRTYKDKEGKKITEDCSVPFEYEEIFEEPDADLLRAQFGGKAAPGSREGDHEELGNRKKPARKTPVDDDGDDWEEAATADEAKKPTRTVKKPANDDDDNDAPAPRGPLPRAPLSKTPLGRKPVKEAEPEEEEEEPKRPIRVGVRRR